MQMTFTKGSGKYDELLVERDGRGVETILCPKQGIIPHDMVHYAVESTLAHRGFLGMVADGAAASFTMTGVGVEDAIERLVETFQAEMWGGRVPAADLLATYEHACAASGHGLVPVSVHQVEAIRVRLEELSAAWARVPVQGSMSVRF